MQGIDQVPVIVKDLPHTAADFERLGFVVVPGEKYENGVQNAHVKFLDGSKIEFLNPTQAIDAQSLQYMDWLRDGDGAPAFGLYRPGSKNTPPPGVFFDRRPVSPTDKLADFDHPNGAVALSGVWLAGSPAERQLQKLPGAKVVKGAFCAPFGYGTEAVHYKYAEVILLSEGMQLVRHRPIVAVTVTVKSLLALQGFLDGMKQKYRREPGCGRKSFWIETRGLWLEFLER
ncbi:MAG: VOC family protein [Proteobacteria bacterium]|nr:VOC family protein [Pseudomonadota bacterium]MBS0547328.1 VOC family protein [Pseudomonadota bacterium]